MKVEIKKLKGKGKHTAYAVVADGDIVEVVIGKERAIDTKKFWEEKLNKKEDPFKVKCCGNYGNGLCPGCPNVEVYCECCGRREEDGESFGVVYRDEDETQYICPDC